MLVRFLLSQTSLPCYIFSFTALSLLFGISQDNSYLQFLQKEPLEYDFIVVGAGSAGCVVANRLSENPNWNVLLLEAGSEEPLLSEVPSLLYFFTTTKYDWQYKGASENNVCNMKGILPMTNGKVMGGTSSINYMIYVRGNQEDYNNWERMGNTGWSYNDVLPYFLKSEDNRDQDILQAGSRYHGTGGYLTVERFANRDPNAEILFQGYQELGMRPTDVNGEHQLGSMIAQSTTRNGSRMSSNGAFIRPIRHRKNLFIKTQKYVTKILIDPFTKTAFGVQYTSTLTGDTKIVLAKKEVIISGGAIESPKLLMLSGIGPISELLMHGIPVMKNLSVGHNLHDHMAGLGIFANVGEGTALLPTCEQSVGHLNTFFKDHTGPLASIGTTTTTGFLQTKFETREGIPDVQLLSSGLSPVLSYFNKIAIIPSLLVPKTRGFVKLNKLKPILGSPEINHRCMVDDDLHTLREAMNMILRIFNTTAFRQNNFTLVDSRLPGCLSFEFNTDPYWNCVVRNFPVTIGEPVGTCKMGPQDDTEAVVDPRLRVHGINNLRVVDASIVPVITRGGLNAPVVMIAEKASDMIKQDWS